MISLGRFGTCLFVSQAYYAYALKRKHNIRSNVFHIRKSPGEPGDKLLQGVDYFFFETVRKPLRGFSMTTRSAGRSTG